MFAIKTDKAGNSIWERQYGGSLNEKGVVVKAVGQYFYIAGVTSNSISGIRNSFLLVLDSKGDTVHHKTFGNQTYSLDINDIAIVEPFVYLVGASYQSSETQPNSYVAKYNPSTDLFTWQRTSPLASKQIYNKIFMRDNDNIVVVGTNSIVAGSPYTHISVAEFRNGSLTFSKNLDAQSSQTFSDALFQGTTLTVTYNVDVSGDIVTQVARYTRADADYVLNWHISTGLNVYGKAIAQTTDGSVALCGEKDNTIHLFQIDALGNITQTSDKVKNLAGYSNRIIPTSDNGWAIVGSTTTDYGAMMQLIKTDKELFLLKR
jgi:hypothetical protein